MDSKYKLLSETMRMAKYPYIKLDIQNEDKTIMSSYKLKLKEYTMNQSYSASDILKIFLTFEILEFIHS